MESDDALTLNLTENIATALQQCIGHLNSDLPPDVQVTAEILFEATQSALSQIMLDRFKGEANRQLNSGSASSADAPRKPIRCYIDGCFDIMHSGHYNAIRQAKALTDILVVGVHSDEEIMRHKGPPVMNNEERLATVRACKWVDEVVFDTPYNPSLELLDRLNCDFCVHGDDMATGADGRDAYEEVKAANRMKIFKRTEGISTTDLVGRLLSMTRSHHLQSATAGAHSPASGPRLESVALGSPQQRLATSTTLAPPLVLDSPTKPANSPVVKTRALSTASNHSIEPDSFASRGISSFLPTTYRITQFSNSRMPEPNDTVVYIDGAFDLFHVGHINTLTEAKKCGTFLYVGLHDDATVNQHKGKNYPIMNLHERVLNVLSCSAVDEVVIGAPWKVSDDLIKSLGIHLVVSGSNTKFSVSAIEAMKADGISKWDDPYEAPKRRKMFREIDTSYCLETDDVVNRIVENRVKFEARNAKRSVKEADYLRNRKEFVREI